MNALELIVQKAERLQARIVFPEWQDDRIMRAVATLADRAIVKPVLVGPADSVRKRLMQAGCSRPDSVRIIDPAEYEGAKDLAFNYYLRRRDRGMGFFQAKQEVAEPLLFSALLVSAGEADGMVGGAAHSTAALVRAALRGIGSAPGISKVSSCVLILSPHREMGADGAFFFADCAVIPNPTPPELADIALATAQTATNLLGFRPAVAFASFSTKGSAKHPLADKMIEALRIAKLRAPDLLMDGELQIDAAVVPSVGASKAPGSQVAGRANIIIFPDINAANIAYKIAQRFGKAEAIGPILQGFRKPVNDLSRGCSADDVVHVAAITALQGQ